MRFLVLVVVVSVGAVSLSCSSSDASDDGLVDEDVSAASFDEQEQVGLGQGFVESVKTGSLEDFSRLSSIPAGTQEEAVFEFQRDCGDWSDVRVLGAEPGVTPVVSNIRIEIGDGQEAGLNTVFSDGSWAVVAPDDSCLLEP